MKKLKDILYRCRIQRFVGDNDIEVDKISFDSRDTTPASVFVAIRGTITDGHKYIPQVTEAGIAAIVCEELPEIIKNEICYVVVKDTSETLGYLACNYYENPSEKINLIGITGTNGKTTTVTLLYELFKSLGYKTGLLSTVRNCVNNKTYPTTHTTPDPLHLNSLLREMVDDGCEYCFMEVSSHSVVQNRITGLNFRGGIFSNLTHDHLDFHKTFNAYLEAKKRFFDRLPAGAFALVNIDDRNGMVMVQNTKSKVYTMAVKKDADFHCKILENQFDGLLLNLNGKEVWTNLVGTFNAYNLLAIYSTARILGLDEEEALLALSKLRPVDGRFEYFKSPDGRVAIVDYAHTPDALKNVIDTINTIRSGAGKLITVVGAGGDRDRTKRPVMAQIAANDSDLVILTSDNPRSEDPDAILAEMSEGIPINRKKISLIITDRKQAIKTACTMAAENDIILVAGKGHETYQEIKGTRFHFDDREVIKEFFNTDKEQK
ncbi:MAG: UDP-N-acetylmuramoyl-L-alanyl-D-glutamate--2,6-diaminopimelate ligase [Omnitrophica WOR_2 bacterium]|jgi:UDP-N-acetylmuramoyl-L-alanyl-D-glutamate--2,6-diaminopimelate ligase